jgi:hypothetical protein
MMAARKRVAEKYVADYPFVEFVHQSQIQIQDLGTSEAYVKDD